MSITVFRPDRRVFLSGLALGAAFFTTAHRPAGRVTAVVSD